MNTSLIIPATTDTPSIIFDSENEQFEIEGRSLPEDAGTFFAPLLQWLERYTKAPNQHTTVSIKLEYYNSASARKVLEIVLILAKISKAGYGLAVNWYYDEDDDLLLEAGEEISSLSGLNFNMIAVH